MFFNFCNRYIFCSLMYKQDFNFPHVCHILLMHLVKQFLLFCLIISPVLLNEKLLIFSLSNYYFIFKELAYAKFPSATSHSLQCQFLFSRPKARGMKKYISLLGDQPYTETPIFCSQTCFVLSWVSTH